MLKINTTAKIVLLVVFLIMAAVFVFQNISAKQEQRDDRRLEEGKSAEYYWTQKPDKKPGPEPVSLMHRILKATLIVSGILVYLFSIWFFRAYRQWLLYYVLGAFGFAVILVLGVRALGVEKYLSYTYVYLMRLFVQNAGVTAKSLDSFRFIIRDPSSFSLLKITIECSALIEFSTLAGLVFFYPVFRPRKKLEYALAGLTGLYILNLLRLSIVVALIHFYGPGMAFVAHAVIGRLFFFVGIIGMCWYMFTRYSLKVVKDRLDTVHGFPYPE